MTTVAVAHCLRDWLADADVVDGAATRLSAAYRRAVSGRSASDPTLLFGCGPLGRHVAGRLAAAGRPATAFIDNDPKAWGRTVAGLPVWAPSDAADRCADDGLFVVTIYNGAAVRRQLEALGCARVLHVHALFHGLPDVFLPYYQVERPEVTLADAERIVEAGDAWADEHSRRVFEALIAARLGVEAPDTGPANMRVSAAADCYFEPSLVSIGRHDFVVDCGAFDGDTIRRVFELSVDGPPRVVAFEPDPASAAALRRYVDGLDPAIAERIEVHRCALSSHDGTIAFDASGTVASAAGNGSIRVPATTIDRLAERTAPTYVKLDVEGHERAVLEGARATLRAHAPVLAISLYHRAVDLWRLPVFIRDANPDYALHLRCHAEDGWESVCYAVPRGGHRHEAIR